MDRIENQKNSSVEIFVHSRVVAKNTFAALKILQMVGNADEESTMVMHGVRIPAGYCDNYEQFITTYCAIRDGDHNLLCEQIPLELSEEQAYKFLTVCSQSMKNKGRKGFTEEEVSDFFEDRRSKKSTGQK